MSWRHGRTTVANPVVSAPLAGVSDKAYRLIVQDMGCGAVFTEMISDKALVYGNKKTFELMDTRGERGPVAVQIFGRDPAFLAPAARIMVEHGARWIDFNMGCPAPKIVKNGEGSALMKEPEAALRAVDALVNAVDVDVSVKMRKGFHGEENTVGALAPRIAALGVSCITVHGRTREQYYGGVADWDCIAQVAAAVDVPVIGNGDVAEPEDAGRMLQATGCTAVMIGRGSFGNPWLFAQTLQSLAGEAVRVPSVQEKVDMAKRHLDLCVHFKGERIAVREMRKQLSWYIKNGRGAARMRDRINAAEDRTTMHRLLDEFGAAQQEA